MKKILLLILFLPLVLGQQLSSENFNITFAVKPGENLSSENFQITYLFNPTANNITKGFLFIALPPDVPEIRGGGVAGFIGELIDFIEELPGRPEFNLFAMIIGLTSFILLLPDEKKKKEKEVAIKFRTDLNEKI